MFKNNNDIIKEIVRNRILKFEMFKTKRQPIT